MEVLVLLPFALAYFSYSLTRYIAEKHLEEKYNGNYMKHSLASFASSIILIIILYLAIYGYIATYQKVYNSFLDHTSPYLWIFIPVTIIFFISEFIVRKLISKNSIYYVIFNTIFLSSIPFVFAWIFANVKLKLA